MRAAKRQQAPLILEDSKAGARSAAAKAPRKAAAPPEERTEGATAKPAPARPARARISAERDKTSVRAPKAAPQDSPIPATSLDAAPKTPKTSAKGKVSGTGTKARAVRAVMSASGAIVTAERVSVAKAAPDTAPADSTALRPARPGAPPSGLDAALAKLKKATRRPSRPAGLAKAARPEAHLEKVLAAAAAENERRARTQAQTTAVALDSVATWIERAEDRLIESSRAASQGHERTALLLHEALTGLTRRLDDIESKMAVGGQPSMDAALKAVERIETQLAEAGQEREDAHESQIDAMLRGFEERIAGISDRLNTPRPIGRRGLDAQIEVRSAVDEIRARQAELDQGGPDRPGAGRSNDAVLSSLRGDIARLAGRLDTIRPGENVELAVAAIGGEIEFLQEAVRGLATREEVNGVERAMRSLVAQTAGASAPGEIAALSATVGALKGDIRRLSESVSSGVQGRLARDLDVLTGKVEAVADSGVDPAMVDPLGERLVDIRRLVAETADPHHVRALEAQIVGLNDRLADLGRQREEFGDLGLRIDELSQKLDRLAETRSAPESLRASIESAPLLTSLVHRLDRLDEMMRHPAPAPELRPIEDMLQLLVERIEQAERPGADYGALDALEQQVASLAERLERQGSDPALLALERAMGHLMTQVGAIRDGAFEAAERAATAAVRDTLTVFPGEEPPELGLLKSDLADLRANHTASDQRTRATLESVGAALEKVVARLGTLEQDGLREESQSRAPRTRPQDLALAAALAPHVPALPETLAKADLDTPARPETTVKAAPAAPAPTVVANPVLEEADRPIMPAGAPEILLEPGAERPRRKTAPVPAETGPKSIPPDIRASLIAAARRAAQSAAAEAADSARKSKRSPASTPGGPSLAARMVQRLDKRRRPILFGLAAIVLTLGAVQTIGVPNLSDATTASGDGSSTTEAPSEMASIEPQRAASSADFVEPKTTQALPSAKPSEAASLPADAKPAETAPAAGPPAGPARQESNPSSPAGKEGAAGPALPAAPANGEARPSSAPTVSARIEPVKVEPPKGDSAKVEAPKVEAPKLDGAKVEAARSEAKTPAFVAAASPQPAPPLSPAASATRAADQRLSSEPRAPFERIAGIAAIGDIPVSIGVPGLRQAALAGDPAAVYDLAARAAEGRGLPRDLKLAAKALETAAQHGLVPAQYRVGNHYEKGLGVPRDLALAKTWYQSAADKGNARAMHNLAVILAEGSGAKPDYAAAAEWFRRAADLGVRDSQFNLAVLYGRGLGVKQDLVTSYTWFSIAAARGDEDAGKKRDEVGARLTAIELASARKLAEAWKVEAPNRATNEVTLPAGGWSEGPPAPATTNVKAAPSNRTDAQPAAANIKGPLPGKGV
jgi:localization factor PodJL